MQKKQNPSILIFQFFEMKINQANVKQVFLPSEYSLYKQLALELNLQNPYQKDSLKKNFKQKYEQHINMIRKNVQQHERFEEKRQKQLREREKKLREVKDYILKKQNKAKKKKMAEIAEKNKKASQNEKKWKEVVDSSHKEYMEALDKSLVLIRKWEDKNMSPINKKNQLMEQISKRNHQHSLHVYNVVSRSRQLQSQQSEQKIAMLNPEYPSKSQAKIRSNMSRYELSEKKCSQSIHKKHRHIYSDHSPKSPDNQLTKIHQRQQTSRNLKNSKSNYQLLKSIRLSKSLSKGSLSGSLKQRILAKKALDEELLEQSLCRNVEKQRKINEARNLKKYISQQKNRLNHEKSQQLLQKLRVNKKNIDLAEKHRKKQLDIKFNQNRSRNRQISLPIIRNKVERTEVFDDGGSHIYLTALEACKEQINTQKYNKAIMDKLRNISLIVSRNKKRDAKFF